VSEAWQDRRILESASRFEVGCNALWVLLAVEIAEGGVVEGTDVGNVIRPRRRGARQGLVVVVARWPSVSSSPSGATHFLQTTLVDGFLAQVARWTLEVVPRWVVSIYLIGVTDAVVARIPVGNLRVPRAEFAAVLGGRRAAAR